MLVIAWTSFHSQFGIPRLVWSFHVAIVLFSKKNFQIWTGRIKWKSMKVQIILQNLMIFTVLGYPVQNSWPPRVETPEWSRRRRSNRRFRWEGRLAGARVPLQFRRRRGPHRVRLRGCFWGEILQIFGGLVIGCIKTKFCKKICVWQHFSRSTRCAYFCTAAISIFSQKIGLKNQQLLWKFSKKLQTSENLQKVKICQFLKIAAR